ncbi:MAG: trigger factor [Candidatus Yanofskybacteria bacterium]|nr:trigger factor [Candidatus Yanofskybacteria bacterium]
MLTKTKELKNSEVELWVELNEEDLKHYLKKTGDRLSGVVQVDGFRAGKVPLDVLRKNIGDQKILEEALEFAVTDSLANALRKEKLEIISSSGLEITENTPSSVKYSIKLLLFPEVKLGEYKGLGVSKKTITVEEKELEDALARILESRTDFKEFDGPAQTGHHLEIDFEVFNAGQLIEGGKSENHPLILGKGGFMPGFEEELLGLSKGQSKNFSVKAPEDYYQKAVAGKNLDFRVTVKSVKAGTVPKLDADFVKSLGNFTSPEELKNVIRDNLKIEKEQKEKDRLRLEILDIIDKKSEIQIPSKLIDEQLESMISNFDNNLHEQGMELAFYLAQVKKTRDDLKKSWYKQAESQVKRGLILREIGKRENLKVSDEEAKKAANSLVARYLVGAPNKQEPDVEKIKQRAGDALLHEKILEFIEKANLSI